MVKIEGKEQFRFIPIYRKDNQFKRYLREKYMRDWIYAAHWVDSSLKTAFSIMDSWRKNCVKGYRKMKCPEARRQFMSKADSL
jgi:putative transposase